MSIINSVVSFIMKNPTAAGAVASAAFALMSVASGNKTQQAPNIIPATDVTVQPVQQAAAPVMAPTEVNSGVNPAN